VISGPKLGPTGPKTENTRKQFCNFLVEFSVQTKLGTGRKYPHKKCDNFYIRNRILANLGFLKSKEKYLSNRDHKTQEVVRDKIPNNKR
jgi:hypothetical protein